MDGFPFPTHLGAGLHVMFTLVLPISLYMDFLDSGFLPTTLHAFWVPHTWVPLTTYIFPLPHTCHTVPRCPVPLCMALSLHRPWILRFPSHIPYSTPPGPTALPHSTFYLWTAATPHHLQLALHGPLSPFATHYTTTFPVSPFLGLVPCSSPPSWFPVVPYHLAFTFLPHIPFSHKCSLSVGPHTCIHWSTHSPHIPFPSLAHIFLSPSSPYTLPLDSHACAWV